MKTTTTMALVAALLAAPLLLGAEPGTQGSRPQCCAATAITPEKPLADKSLYQLDAAWTDDSGRSVKLNSLRSRPQIVLMFFASCPYACPLLVQQVKGIEAAIPETMRGRVGFTLVTFDTERDTPQVLKAYRAQHDLPAGRWTLLRGDSDAVLDLAALLGVQFRKDANGQFQHSNLVTLLNSDGEIVFQQAGLNGDPQEMVRHVEQLFAPKPCRP